MKKGIRFKRIKTKMLIGFGLLVILAGGMGMLNYYTVKDLNTNTEEIVDEHMPLLINSEELSAKMFEASSLVHGYILHNDDTYEEDFIQTLGDMQEIEDNIIDMNNSMEVQALGTKRELWTNSVESAIRKFERGNDEDALNSLLEADETARDIQNRYASLTNDTKNTIFANGKNTVAQGNINQIVTLILSWTVFFLGIIIAIFTAGLVSKPVKAVMKRQREI